MRVLGRMEWSTMSNMAAWGHGELGEGALGSCSSDLQGRGAAWLMLVSLSLEEGLGGPGPRRLRRECPLVLVSLIGTQRGWFCEYKEKVQVKFSYCPGRTCCCWGGESLLGDTPRNRNPAERSGSLLLPPALPSPSSAPFWWSPVGSCWHSWSVVSNPASQSKV